MKRFRNLFCLMLSLFLALCFAARAEEGPAEEMEQGLEEIQPLLEQSDVDETEGMGLEEMTDAFTESAMSEYIDSTTGFSMQYPSIFVFDESKSSSVAMTADRKASLSIDNMINQGGLDEQALTEAIRLEAPDAELQRNEQNGCLRCDRTTDNGSVGQTDLYFLTETSFHHIILRYPSEEKETYFSYIEYMINTMEAKDTDLG